jgi:alkanesulfonate monooxygenase SsuD/methylene tetrahydromethanopterin reductase-like flavin-dependent oxidoreductase (luciferase family)
VQLPSGAVPVPEAGSVSMRLYPHNDLDATGIVDELVAQAALAAEVGFDGVMTSEHHGGFAGYSPNPLQVTGWLLQAMATGWCAPCPMLLPLRPTALVAEEVAWLAARFPDRVAVGVAPGALPLDFEVMEVPFDEKVDRFRIGLPQLAAMLRGEALGQLSGDRALQVCAERPVTVIGTAMSAPAVRRAASAGAGVVYDGGSAPDRLRLLSDAYDEAGGRGPKVLIRRVWLGDPPIEAFDRQLDVYRSYTPAAAQQHWRDNGFLCRDDPAALVDDLRGALIGSGSTVLNLRVHVPGVSPAAAREQIARLGAEVLPLLRAAPPG